MLMATSNRSSFLVQFTSPPAAEGTTTTAISWKSRLCWVHRKSDDKSFCWPAICFMNWAEAVEYCCNEMSVDQKLDYCAKVYETHNEQSLVAVVKLLGLDTLEFQEINNHEKEKMEEDVFCGAFCDWFPSVSRRQTKPSDFEHKSDWYLPFMKAIDESMSLLKGEACDKMFRLGKQELDDMAASRQPERDPIESPATESTEVDSKNSQETIAQVSPEADSNGSPSSCEETPTHTNKTRSKLNRQLMMTPASSESQENIVSSETSTTVGSKKGAAKNSDTPTSVTPSRSSSRPKRKPRKDVGNISFSDMARPWKKRNSSDFYSFNDLMPQLVKHLGWKYRRATNKLRTWVYEREETNGEIGGQYLEDYFYEEEDVEEYCRRNDYEGKYRHLWMKDKVQVRCDNVVTPPKQTREEEVATKQ